MTPIGSPLSDEGRQFLQRQAKQLMETNSPAILETSTAHSRYVGRVIEVQDGGIVFEEQGTNNQARIPWERVDYLIGVPQSRSSATAGSNR